MARIDEMIRTEMDEKELTKVKNKHKTSKVFSEQSLMNRVMNIAFFENMGMIEELSNELHHYDIITSKAIQDFAKKTFDRSKQSILHVKIKTDE